jgi:hypothetical protein
MTGNYIHPIVERKASGERAAVAGSPSMNKSLVEPERFKASTKSSVRLLVPEPSDAQ